MFELVLHFSAASSTQPVELAAEIRQVIQMLHFCYVELNSVEFDIAEVQHLNQP